MDIVPGVNGELIDAGELQLYENKGRTNTFRFRLKLRLTPATSASERESGHLSIVLANLPLI